MFMPIKRLLTGRGVWPAALAMKKVFPNLEVDVTFSSIFADAISLACALTELGLVKGDVVSFQMPNWHEAAVINLACAVAGFVANPIVIIYRNAEVQFMLQDSAAKVFSCPSSLRILIVPA